MAGHAVRQQNIDSTDDSIEIYIEKTNLKKYMHLFTINYSWLQIKRSTTNMFVTFIVNGSIIFSCTAGSAGMRKKERRLKHSSFQCGTLFGKFVRTYTKRRKVSYIFNNIITVLHAPVSYLRAFIIAFKESLHKKMYKRNKKALIRQRHELKKVNNFSIILFKKLHSLVRYNNIRDHIGTNCYRMYNNMYKYVHNVSKSVGHKLNEILSIKTSKYSLIYYCMSLCTTNYDNKINKYIEQLNSCNTRVTDIPTQQFTVYFNTEYNKKYVSLHRYSKLQRDEKTAMQHGYKNGEAVLLFASMFVDVLLTNFFYCMRTRIHSLLRITVHKWLTRYKKLSLLRASIVLIYRKVRTARLRMASNILNTVPANEIYIKTHDTDYAHNVSGIIADIWLHTNAYAYVTLQYEASTQTIVACTLPQHIHLFTNMQHARQTNIIKKIKTLFMKTLRRHIRRVRMYMPRFRIRMFNDQSTFPFNGCRGKSRYRH